MRIHKNYGFIVVSVMFYLLLHIGTYTGLLVDFILIIRKFSFLNAFRQAPFKFPPKTNEYSFSHLGLTFRSLILQVVNLYFSREKKRSNFLNQLSNTQKNIPFFQKQLVDIPMPLDFVGFLFEMHSNFKPPLQGVFLYQICSNSTVVGFCWLV